MEKYGRLTPIKFVSSDKHRNDKWLFACDCGNKKVISIKHVKYGKTRSCGCLRKEEAKKNNTSHGKEGTKIYNIWKAMKKRCNNPNDPSYCNYGGRGIKVCDKWEESFENFYEDMGDRPEGKSIERIDNNKGYCPENCVWETRRKQNINQRIRKDNSTGVKGVCKSKIGEYVSYVAYARGEGGKRISKTFSVKKYGEDEAFLLACEARKHFEEIFNYN